MSPSASASSPLPCLRASGGRHQAVFPRSRLARGTPEPAIAGQRGKGPCCAHAAGPRSTAHLSSVARERAFRMHTRLIVHACMYERMHAGEHATTSMHLNMHAYDNMHADASGGRTIVCHERQYIGQPRRRPDAPLVAQRPRVGVGEPREIERDEPHRRERRHGHPARRGPAVPAGKSRASWGMMVAVGLTRKGPSRHGVQFADDGAIAGHC